MGFLKDILFGSKPEANIQSRSLLDPAQQEALSRLLGGIGDPNEVEKFTGSFAAPTSSLENTSLQALEDRAIAQAQGGTDLQGESRDALSNILTRTPQDIEGFFQSNVFDPLEEQFREDVLPATDRKFAKNFFSGGRVDANERDLENFGDALVQGKSDLSFRSFFQDTQDKLGAAGQAGILEQGEIGNLLQLLGAGGIPRSVEQTELLGQFDEFVRQQEQRNKQLQLLQGAIGIPTRENIATVTGGSQGLLGGFLSGGGGNEAGKQLALKFLTKGASGAPTA